MNKSLATTLVVMTIILSSATAFAAAKPALTNGGLGQVANNPQSFGIAVCNRGAKAVSEPATLTVNANGRSVNAYSAASIGAGACAYTYLAYSQFDMQAGATYPVTVMIGGSASNQATYSVTVPSTQAMAKAAAKGTANVGTQSGDFFSMLSSWFSGLLGKK